MSVSVDVNSADESGLIRVTDLGRIATRIHIHPLKHSVDSTMPARTSTCTAAYDARNQTGMGKGKGKEKERAGEGFQTTIVVPPPSEPPLHLSAFINLQKIRQQLAQHLLL